MTVAELARIFAIAVTLHNLEEAVFLPAEAKRLKIPVDPGEFRFALAVLTLFAYLCAWLTGKGNALGVYMLSGYALTMMLNVFAPHLIATVVLRRYAPGTATAILFNLPAGVFLLRSAFAERRISASVFAWAGPLMVVGIVASLPLLFAAGRALNHGRCAETGFGAGEEGRDGSVE